MKNLLGILLFIFLTSCSEESKSERYFADCVKDGMKVHKWEESYAVFECEWDKKDNPDKFKYYKGKIYSKKK